MKAFKAYKVFNENWICNPDNNPFQYEIGKTYEIKEEPILCKKGFHACKKITDCFTYYSFDPKNKVAEVELSGIILGKDGDKQVAQKITILKEITWVEMLIMANTGSGNTGHSNSGYSNSGNSNSGNSNSGYRNSGDSNSGDRNSGNSNSGYSNSGDSNSGDRNSGNSNSGYSNSGDSNSGDSNSGNSNSGYSNSGDSNSGDSNSGNSNSGDRNSGDRNSGDSNSGYRNSGNSNSGDRNSGNSNSGDFNSTTPDIANYFNKPCKITDWNNATKPNFIYNVNVTLWIEWSAMTDKEKEDNKNAFVTDGYLKVIPYKKAWANAYKDATEEDIKLLKALPNFDVDVFFEITGIKIT
jgi:hypothetical protein